MPHTDSNTNRRLHKWPSAFIGMVLGLNLLMSVVVIAYPFVAGAAVGLCPGQYACFTAAACQKAKGDFIACPDKCAGAGTQGYCYAKQPPIDLKISIGGASSVIDVGDYIQKVYRYSIGVAAIVAATMMMIGGLQYLISAGGGQKDAGKKRIINGLVGLLLTIFAYTILNTINPSLVSLQMPRVPMVRQETLVACQAFNMLARCGEHFGLKEKEGAAANTATTERFEKVALGDPDMLTECIGMSCSKAGSNDGTNTCQTVATTTPPATPPATPPSATGPVPPYQCVPCNASGACTGIGPNNTCCGRFCSLKDAPARRTATGVAEAAGVSEVVAGTMDGTCSNGMHGLMCGVGSECFGGKCIGSLATAGGVCSNGSAGAPCSQDADCSGGVCIATTGINVCVTPVPGGICADDGDCPSGGYSCSVSDSHGNRTVDQGRCVSRAVGAAQACDDDADCASSSVGATSCVSGVCTTIGLGSPCDATNNDCTARGTGGFSGFCYNDAVSAAAEADILGSVTNYFLTITAGSVLDIPGALLNVYRNTIHAIVGRPLGICTAGGDGNGCDGPDDCLSGVCVVSVENPQEGSGERAFKFCIGPHTEAGSPCRPGAGAGQCANRMTCHANGICIPGQ